MPHSLINFIQWFVFVPELSVDSSFCSSCLFFFIFEPPHPVPPPLPEKRISTVEILLHSFVHFIKRFFLVPEILTFLSLLLFRSSCLLSVFFSSKPLRANWKSCYCCAGGTMAGWTAFRARSGCAWPRSTGATSSERATGRRAPLPSQQNTRGSALI